MNPQQQATSPLAKPTHTLGATLLRRRRQESQRGHVAPGPLRPCEKNSPPPCRTGLSTRLATFTSLQSRMYSRDELPLH